MQTNNWARLLAYATSLVNQRLLLQSEYFIAENRILRSHLSGNLRHRRLIARKFDGFKHRSYPGRPRVDLEVEALIRLRLSYF